jgi:hypothetical protein
MKLLNDGLEGIAADQIRRLLQRLVKDGPCRTIHVEPQREKQLVFVVGDDHLPRARLGEWIMILQHPACCSGRISLRGF